MPAAKTEEIGAFTIREFCDAFRISEASFYRMQNRGEGPATMPVGGRTLISRQAAEAWRLAREKAQREKREREGGTAP
jgi:predicted DNA-binding transcriptional regulator AlpA